MKLYCRRMWGNKENTCWMCVDYTDKHVQSFIWSKTFHEYFYVTSMPWKRGKRSIVSVCSVSQKHMNIFDTNILKCIAFKFLAMTWIWYFDLYFPKLRNFVWKNNVYDFTKFSCTLSGNNMLLIFIFHSL